MTYLRNKKPTKPDFCFQRQKLFVSEISDLSYWDNEVGKFIEVLVPTFIMENGEEYIYSDLTDSSFSTLMRLFDKHMDRIINESTIRY